MKVKALITAAGMGKRLGALTRSQNKSLLRIGGKPLITHLLARLKSCGIQDIVVVTGYDDQRQGVYVHSSLDKDVFVPYERFLPSWDKTGRWTLLVTPSERRLRSHA